MAKLYFRYGSMNSGKSLDILKVCFNYEEKGKNILILSSSIDTRSGENKIKSRIGLERECIFLTQNDNIIDIYLKNKNIDCVLVDECQFLTKEQVYQLSDIVDIYQIPVICYGLRSDFKMNYFEGSAYLMAISDTIEEIKTICWCGKKAIVNARINDNKIITDGEQICVGGNDMYISLCRKHYKESKLK